MVILETNYGKITMKLDVENTPKTAQNFLDYVKSGFYDGVLFHRIINNFMVQGGGFDSSFQQKTAREPVQNEAEKALANKRGTVAMARTSDPHSATSQFFINVSDNDFLNYKNKNSNDAWGYCVFATVIEGMDVVDKMKKVNTSGRSGHQDVPVDDVVINRAYVEEEVT